MPSIEHLFSEIDDLTAQIVLSLSKNDFSITEKLFQNRLDLLYALDKKFNRESASQSELARYKNFLEKVQQDDNEQIQSLVSEQSTIKQKALQQSKSNVAISAYKKISG